MKRTRLVVSSLAAAAVLVAAIVAPSLQAGQRGQAVAPDQGGRQGAPFGFAQGGAAPGGGRARGPQAPAGPTPRLPNGKPDLSGLWANPYTPNMAGRGALVHPTTRQPLTFARQGERLTDAADTNRTFDLPYTDWGLKQWKTYDPANQGDYAGNCLPFGTARNLNAPHGLLIIQNNDALAFLFEQDTWFHWVPTMPSFKWPADLPPSWSGVSTGRWEGDTLIIETTGFNGYTKLDTTGHPHSSQLTLINTFTRTDSRTMQHTMTVRDQKAFTQEWMNVRTWRTRDAPDVIMEYSCDENNLHNILDGVIKVWKPPVNVD